MSECVLWPTTCPFAELQREEWYPYLGPYRKYMHVINSRYTYFFENDISRDPRGTRGLSRVLSDKTNAVTVKALKDQRIGEKEKGKEKKIRVCLFFLVKDQFFFGMIKDFGTFRMNTSECM